MIWKRITYSDHATMRLRQRRITRQMVRVILARGERRPAETRAGEQRWESIGIIGHRVLSVIFMERADEIHVVTVQWVPEE